MVKPLRSLWTYNIVSTRTITTSQLVKASVKESVTPSHRCFSDRDPIKPSWPRNSSLWPYFTSPRKPTHMHASIGIILKPQSGTDQTHALPNTFRILHFMPSARTSRSNVKLQHSKPTLMSEISITWNSQRHNIQNIPFQMLLTAPSIAVSFCNVTSCCSLTLVIPIGLGTSFLDSTYSRLIWSILCGITQHFSNQNDTNATSQ